MKVRNTIYYEERVRERQTDRQRQRGNGMEERVTSQRKRDKKISRHGLLIRQQHRRGRRLLGHLVDEVELPGATLRLPDAETKCRRGKDLWGKTFTKGEGSVKLISLYQLVYISSFLN
jgi:hypothetical protein